MLLDQVVRGLPTDWLEAYVATFEAGRVQRQPRARFVGADGDCCIVGALAGARTSAEVVASPVYAGFNGSALERVSRAFEARTLTGQQFYEETLLALVERSAETYATASVEGVGAGV